MSSDNQQHAARGPSGAAARRLCPGKANAERDKPDNSSEASIDGTKSHYLLECCVKQHLASPHGFVGGTLIDPQYGEFVVDRERAARVAVAIDYVNRRIRDMADEYGPCAVRAEEKADPGVWMGRSDVWGTVDITLVWQAILEIADYKDGMHPVDAEGNDQLVRYALGRLAEYVDPATNTVPFHTVRMTIIQPKRAQMGEDPIRSWEIPTTDLIAMLPEQIAVEAAADDPNAPRIPGDEQCRYCRAKPCDAFLARGLQAAEAAFASVKVGTLDGVSRAEPVDDSGYQVAAVTSLLDRALGADVASLDDEALEEIMNVEDVVLGLFKSAREQANKRALAGTAKFRGWVLEAGRSSRAYKASEEEVAKWLAGRKSVALDRPIRKADIYEQTLLSPAKVEKSGLLDKKQLAKFLETFVAKKEGQPRLVRVESAKNPVSPETKFADIPVGTLSSPSADGALSLI